MTPEYEMRMRCVQLAAQMYGPSVPIQAVMEGAETILRFIIDGPSAPATQNQEKRAA